MKDWKDIFMDEDPAGEAKTDLPTDNEKKGEDNGQDSEAAGALSENDDPQGMKTVPAGEDEITGEKSTDYADVFAFLDEGDAEEGKGDEEGDKPEEGKPAEGEEEKKEGDGPAAEPKNKKKAGKKRRNSFSIFDEDPVGEPKTDLPTDNEKAGEDNGQGSEAAGALSEDDSPKGMQTVPAGEDEITGEKSTDYADFFSLLDEDDAAAEGDEKKEDKPADDPDKKEGEEAGEGAPAEAEGEEKKDCGGSKKRKPAKRNFWSDEDDAAAEGDNAEGKKGDEGEKKDDPAEGEKPAEEAKQDKKKRRRNFWEDDGDETEGSDDDGQSEKEPVGKPDAEEGKEKKEEEKKEEDEEATEDSWNSFFDEGFEEPENLPGDPKPAEIGKVNGEEVCPNGCADLPEKELTEPVLVPVETKNGEQQVLQNRRHVSDRYFFN